MMMSEVLEFDDPSCCASCGITAKDDIELKKCDACKLVRYCNVKCQKEHRPNHERACEKRVAELRDEILFRQPESRHLGDCPLCCLPHPVDRTKAVVTGCCSKMICRGCFHANLMREFKEALDHVCPFCRHPAPKARKESYKLLMRRVEANDPLSLVEVGMERLSKGDYAGAFKYWTKAAELGDAEAHFHLSVSYHDGKGVQTDLKKQVYHLEIAAIAGHPYARHNLGCIDEMIYRAVKHLIISANLGCDEAIQKLKEYYKYGKVSKEDFAAALRGHHAAVDATKSPQRREAAEASMYMRRF